MRLRQGSARRHADWNHRLRNTLVFARSAWVEAAAVDNNFLASQQMCGEFGCLLFQLLQCHIDGGAADCRATTAECANTILHNGSIAVDHGHVIYVNTEFVSRDLGEGSFLALSVWRSSSHDGNFRRWLNTDRGRFPSAIRQCRGRPHGAYLHIG